jgi:simple sugar transport system ATP-binding protein
MLGDDASPGDERAVLVTDTASHPAASRAPVRVGHEPSVIIAARELDILDERGVLRIRSAELSVHAGEIVGVAAVEGSGHRELLRGLAGRLRSIRGSLVLPPAVGFIPEDRHHEALALDLSLAQNVALRGAGRRRGVIGWRSIARHTMSLMEQFDIRAPGAHTPARALSGGNQQKLVLARELDGKPAALVAENPTRGLDVHATAAVHDRLRQARDAGMAIVLYSSDVDETLALADRMLVVFDGGVRAVRHDRAAVGSAMIGLA